MIVAKSVTMARALESFDRFIDLPPFVSFRERPGKGESELKDGDVVLVWHVS